jgi:ankyrin repeat protein
MIGSQAGAECGNLCDRVWWRTATEVDVQAELDGDADVMARNKWGFTPLHFAARIGTPANIQALLDANADAKVKNEKGKTPWDLAQENEKLKGTKGYWALNDAQYN